MDRILKNRIKKLDVCLEVLSDWYCERQEIFEDTIYKYIDSAMMMLTRIKSLSITMDNGSFKELSESQKFANVLNDIFDEETKSQLINIATKIN